MALQQVHTGFTFSFDKSKLGAIDRGVRNAASNMKTVTSKSDAFQRRMSGFWDRAKGVIGAYLGYRAVRGITKDYAQGADAIAKFAAGLGISAQQYQRMTHAAQLNGITVEELNMAIPKLAKSAGDAADGSKSMADAFRRAHVSVRNNAGNIKDPITLLTDLADGMKTVKDEGRKTQILMNIFGRAGKKMGVLMDQGADGIRKAMAEADKLGIVLSKKQLKAAENYNDEMLRVKAVMLGIRNTIAGEVLPILTRQLRAFQIWWREGNNAERALRALKGIAFFTGLVLAKMVTALVIKKMKAFTLSVINFTRSLKAANVQATIANIKILLIAAAIVMVALVIQDLVYFAQGKDSLIGRILGPSELATELRNALLSLGRAAVAAWRDIKPALLEAWIALKPVLAELAKLLKPIIGMAFRATVYGLIGALTYLKHFLKGISWQINLLRKFFSNASDAATKLAKAIGTGLAAGVRSFSKAFPALSAGIKTALGPAIFAMQKLVDLRNKVFGVEIGEQKLGERTQSLRQKLHSEAGITLGGNVATVPGLYQPAPVAAFAHAAAGTRVNTNVAPGAVVLNVTATGDPEANARAINARVQAGLNKAFTGAARDIRKPPAGQR